MIHEVKIEYIGENGDGIAVIDGKKAFVPYTLAGETVEVETLHPRSGGVACRAVKVIHASTARREAPCPHFENCGGCSMQHVSIDTYRQWKLNAIQTKMNRAELGISLSPLLWEKEHTRKRATFHFQKKEGVISSGFHAPYSSEIINMDSCVVLSENLKRIFDGLRLHASLVCKASKKFSVQITLYEDKYIDAAFTIIKKPSEKIYKALAAMHEACAFAKTSVRFEEHAAYEEVATSTNLPLSYGEHAVNAPSGSFSQATYTAEQTMQRRVYEELKDAQNIADLFCGSGTFTLPFLGQAKSITSADITYNAVRELSTKEGVIAQERNLFKHPFETAELNEFDTVIIDPPRAGAKEQCAELAKSSVKKIVMISCDSSSFVRDAQILKNGGYTLHSAELVDQFIYSPHSEIISVYTK